VGSRGLRRCAAYGQERRCRAWNHPAEVAGTASVEIRDEAGKPVPGFALAECDAIGGNCVAKVVTWRGRSDVSALAGKVVRLHLRMRATKLFGFQFR